MFKKKSGLVGDIINGTGGLVISVILTLVVISTLFGANLLTVNSSEYNATDLLISNFTSGIGNVATKIPTILLIAAVVILFGVLVFLVARAKQMQLGGNGSL
tara:strand:- start:263 stop:568 length:306 start_codon:yes stop_codon:yes gene_type:complete